MAEATPLVITPTLPPTTGRDVQGINRRLSLFLKSIGDDSGPIRLLRLVPERIFQEWAGQGDRLDEIELDFWGRRVSVVLAPRRQRAETFYRHYIAGIPHAAQQPDLFPYGGDAVTSEIVSQLDRPTSLVFVQTLPAMCAMLQTGRRPQKMFFDVNDVEHRVRLRYAVQPPIWPGKLLYALHVPALFGVARWGAQLSGATFVCSQRDRDHLMRLGLRRVAVVPNAVGSLRSVPPLAAEPTILFLGVMSYGPNVEAVTRLIRKVMPLVWQAMPAARLLVAGDGSDGLPSACDGDDRIEYLGFVADLDALYARARIVCCPLTNGGGTRIKLIEAAAYGKPMAATPVGAEGLAFTDGEEILLRKDDAGLAEACVRLLRDDALCVRLGASANAKMRELYETSRIVSSVRAIMEQAG